MLMEHVGTQKISHLEWGLNPGSSTRGQCIKKTKNMIPNSTYDKQRHMQVCEPEQFGYWHKFMPLSVC